MKKNQIGLMKPFKKDFIPVMEHFYTLQGEGVHSGNAAYFIRVAGCDVGCVWCDVKASWMVDEAQLLNIYQLAEDAQKYPASIVVITGGEPLIYDMLPLTKVLKDIKRKIHLETSGAYPLSGYWDWICLSPKKFKPALPEIYTKANELKIIAYHKSDFQWAEQQALLVNQDCKLLLQPEWSVAHKMIPLIVEYIKINPRWQVSLQSHKYLNIP